MIVSDFKYAVRLLSKRPGFTVLTILVMAAGIGLSLYLFSFMNAMIFKPLPFKDGASIMELSSIQNGVKVGGPVNLHDYQEIRENLNGLTEFSAYNTSSVNVSGRDGARRFKAVSAEPNIFQLTRTQPILGREFTPDENRPGAEHVVVISHDLWQSEFGGDDQVIDETLRINGMSHRVIGVMPEGYYFPNTADLWQPLRESATTVSREDAASVYGLAHISDGHSIETVNQQLGLVMERLRGRYPDTNSGLSASISTIQMSIVGEGIAVVYALHIAAILILCLASINVGNLLLSRAVERSKETAIRVALGAPRSRLIGQMMWESIIICTVGGVIGLLVLAWGLEYTESFTASFFVDKAPFWWTFGIDAHTIKLFFMFVLGTILVTGLLPVWRSTGSDFNAVLRDGTRGATGRKAGWLNKLLVISEIFLSMIILLVASVIVIGAYKATHANYGADTDNTLTAKIVLTENTYESDDEKTQFAQTLQSRLENSTGIGNVMISTSIPGEFANTPPMAIENREYTEEGDNAYPRENYIGVTPGTLDKLGVELREGRYFNTGDDGIGKKTVIVTDSFASRHFPNDSALGKRLRIVESEGDEQSWLTIIGVVEHTVHGLPNETSGRTPSVFRPFSQAPSGELTVAMRLSSDEAAARRTLQSTLESIDSDLPAYKIETYQDSIVRLVGPLRFVSMVIILFGLAAVILAASGIYGVMANSVSQKTQEIGVKRAFGAMDERISWEFIKTGIKTLLWGGIPGLAAGLGLGLAMSKGVGAETSEIIAVAIALTIIIGAVVLMATYLPTKRALLMSPSEALRYD